MPRGMLLFDHFYSAHAESQRRVEGGGEGRRMTEDKDGRGRE